MRKLLVLRGIPGSGKSTWVKEHQLEAYTLSSDHIRTLFQAPCLNEEGTFILHDYEHKKVWSTLNEMLEVRMNRGEFVIVDATNTTKAELKRYKDLANKYRYQMFCVDFSECSIETAKKQNQMRNSFERVPESVIDRMYERLRSNLDLSSGIVRIKPDEFETIFVSPMNLSSYQRIHQIGDIHGCYTVLMEYLKEGIKEDEFYIFLGDYLDRGIENAKVIQFLTSIVTKPNVIFLEGNHEKHLRRWANGEVSNSKEFEEKTRKELEQNEVNKAVCREFCKRLAQCAFYSYEDKTFFVSHAGISTIPKNLLYVSANQMIEGVGSYSEVEKVEETFDHTMPETYYQIHGHRNNNSLPVHASKRNYNLEGQVEFGGCLRCVQVEKEGIHTIELLNRVYTPTKIIRSIKQAIKEFQTDQDIKEKAFGTVVSFNFTRKAFYQSRWNERTVTARGLYIDTEKEKVVARGYNKFFNMEEVKSTETIALQQNLKYPVTAYVKENGFLGIISLNKQEDDLFVTTKSDPTGIYAVWFKELLKKKLSERARADMMQYLKTNDVTFLFEVVDMEHDPHIIEYAESEIYLLDLVANDLVFSKLEYQSLKKVAEKLSLRVKELAYTLNDWEAVSNLKDRVSSPDYLYKGNPIEGFVLEDASGFMFKMKSHYYREWKLLRGLKDRILSGRPCSLDLMTEQQFAFYQFVKNQKELNREESNICQLRKRFLE